MPLFFWFDLFLEARTEILKKKPIGFLVETMAPKRHFEINWPLKWHHQMLISVGLITSTENVPKIFQRNFCDQWSNSFILKSFYQILLTSSNTYLLSLYVYCATHHKYDHNTPLPPQYSVAKIDENWRILWHFRSICYATFKSTQAVDSIELCLLI